VFNGPYPLAVADPDPEALLQDALERVRAISAIANEEDRWQERWDVLRQLRPLGRQAFDKALGLLRGHFWDRTLGCDLLAVLCNPDEDGWGHEAAVALVESSSGKDDPEFLWSLANALQCAADPIALPVLTRLAEHPDRDVRLAVAQGIVFCRTNEDEEDTQPICDVLVSLMEDEDDEIRDWATTGLGQQIDTDNWAIRNALSQRIGDRAPGVQWEAILGLARRHDHKVLELIREGLSGDIVDRRAVQAAGHLADRELFPMLHSLALWWSEWPQVLERALAQCDPELQEFRFHQMAHLRSSLEERFCTKVPESRIAIVCPVMGHLVNEVDLIVIQNGTEVGRWSVSHLLEARCVGDPEGAADAVVADLLGRQDESKGD
jgi:HEAT repeat protein